MSVVRERREHVEILRIDRPEAKNAINDVVAHALEDALDDIESDTAVRVVVITGTGDTFSAGADLKMVAAGNSDAFITKRGGFAGFVARDFPKPVVAAVNGTAVAGGFEIALACDFIVASERAAFADTHLRVGVFPGPVLLDLPRRIGMPRARELSLTGNFVDAETAARIGIANHVVPHDELLPFTLSVARAIAEQDPTMVAAVRRAWDATENVPLTEAARLHLEHAAASATNRSGADIAAHRDAVLSRSREQRGTGG